MSQCFVLGEHTIRHLEAAGVREAVNELERVEVALVLHHLHRRYGINVFLAFGICIGNYHFDTDCILQTLFVDYASDGIFLTALYIALTKFFALVQRYDFNAIPLGSHFFQAAISLALALSLAANTLKRSASRV